MPGFGPETLTSSSGFVVAGSPINALVIPDTGAVAVAGVMGGRGVLGVRMAASGVRGVVGVSPGRGEGHMSM